MIFSISLTLMHVSYTPRLLCMFHATERTASFYSSRPFSHRVLGEGVLSHFMANIGMACSLRYEVQYQHVNRLMLSP
jgi:hypothetical protein